MKAALVVCVALTLAGSVHAQEAPTPWTDLPRFEIPDELPPHPRVFCTQADIDRIRADYEAGDDYTRVCVDQIAERAAHYLSAELEAEGTPGRNTFSEAALLAQAWALTGNEQAGRRALAILMWAARVAPTLEPTRSAGLFTDSTLIEGPLAANASMAYDLIASAPWVTDEQRSAIEDDLLRKIGWTSGRGCRHLNSSNWRSWGMAISAATGFSAGDFDLIEGAINGVWDPDRNAYIYGLAQQIGHSFFADGIHWERSMGYTYYTSSALVNVVVPAQIAGIDVWGEIAGIEGPFVGGAGHEEFGPPGPRSLKYLLDAPFYYAFPDFSFARVGDSGTSRLAYHPIYELAWQQYRDPKYAWLINRARNGDGDAPAYWSIWRPAGSPEAVAVSDAHSGGTAWRLKTGADGRVALVQNVSVPSGAPVTVSGWVKALSMDGGSAHIRCNFGSETVFTDDVRDGGDWRQVSCTLKPVEDASAGQMRSVRLHVFLEGGTGEVIWDDISVTVGDATTNAARNGGFEAQMADGRRTDFWSLVHAAADVPEGHFSLAEDATIGLVGVNENGCSNFPVGGFTILRSDAADEAAPAVNVAWGPYGSGHDHPDRLEIVFYGLGGILCPDAGSWGYENPMHLTWANQTIAHNTLTVDEVAQNPQGMSDRIWTGEGDTRVFGVQHLFDPGERLKAARFTCDTAYDGVTMDRTVCLVGGPPGSGYLVDVFSATSADEHLYDLPLHGPGAVAVDAPMEALPEGALSARGYAHLANARAAQAPELLRATFQRDETSLLMLQAPPEGAQVIAAEDPVRSGNAPTSCVISRVRGREATWVSVLEPFAGAPAITDLSVEETDDGLRVVVTHDGGADELTVPEDEGTAVVLRQMAAGE